MDFSRIAQYYSEWDQGLWSGAEAKIGIGVLLWWCFLGLRLAYEKGSFGPDAVLIGTHFLVKPVINKVEICPAAKRNAEILLALEEIMDISRSMIRHGDVRKVAGKESWVAGSCRN